MNKRIVVFAVLIFSLKMAFGQYTLKNAEDVNWYSNIAQEEIFVHYNADVIFSGEYLYYKVYCKNSKTKEFTKNSKIAYVELLGKNGVIFKHKIRLINGLGQGDFFLPASVPTGNYKLIAYTQWMKNGLTNHFFRADVSVINPYAKINFDETGQVTHSIDVKSSDYSQIKLETNSDTYNKREEVTLKIETLNASNAYGEYSISVRKLEDLGSSKKQPSAETYQELYGNAMVSKPRKIGETMYLPEFKGEMVKGRVTQKTTNVPADNIEVALSILSDEAYQNIALTNEDGVFYFQLTDDYSQTNAMVQVVGDNRSDYRIEVADHESIDVTNVSIDDIKISETYKDAIIKRSVYNQVQNAYETVKRDQIITPKYPEPFYGNYQHVFKLDDYKRFPTIAETLIEIVDHAWHERKNGKLRVINVRERENDPYYGVDLLPMIVADGALVQDHESILYYDAKNVESISVLRDEYYYGDRVYQGLLAVNTFDKNYADRLTGDHVKKFNLLSPQLKAKYFRQEYLNESDSDRIPDFRTQLLWLPELHFQRNSMDVKFYTSDNTGTYVISLEGFTNTGHPISIKKTITVK